MNVYVVSFDESENADDPLLRAFSDRVQMAHAVNRMSADTVFYAEVREALNDGGDFTLSLWDDDLDERLQLHVRTVRVEEVEAVMAEGKL